MANRISGITVKIGGDTTGLSKALSGVNLTIKKTQTSLKDVNRLLKLDPKSTELLSQKQKLLKDSINATKEKLTALKDAQKQAKEQLENGTLGQEKYDALQREIVQTENELKRLESEARKAQTTLAKMDQAGKSLENLGESVSSVGKKLMPATMAVGALGSAAVKTTSEFDSSMAKVSAVSGATGDEFLKLRDKAREMGAKTKFSASEAADAFNYMAMAGWKTADMLDGIEGIMNLAAASGEDLATTSDIVTDALTAFGLKSKDSGHFADILASASSNANTNVRMMGETFKYCAPIAGALGYTAEDTAEAIGLMANSGIKSTQAGTALRRIMTELSSPSGITLTGKAIGKMTIKTTNQDGSMRKLGDTLRDLRKAYSKLSESEKASAANNIAGKNAMSGFLALMNAGEKDVSKLENAISKCDGASLNMAQTMQDNLGGQLTILKSQVSELAISIGDSLMPTIRSIVSKIQEFVDKLNKMDKGTKDTIIKIGLFVASLGPVLLIVGKLTSTIGKSLQMFSKLGAKLLKLGGFSKGLKGVFLGLKGALSGVTAPIIAVVAVVTTLIAAFKHLWTSNKEFKKNFTDIFLALKNSVKGTFDSIINQLNSLGFNFKSITDVIKKVWGGFCSLLGPVFIATFSQIANVIKTVLNVVLNVVTVFVKVFKGDFSGALSAVGDIFKSTFEGVKNVFKTQLLMIKNEADTVLKWFGSSWTKAWNAIKSFFIGIWTSIKSFFLNIFTAIKLIVLTSLIKIKETITNVFTKIKTFTTSVWNLIKVAISVAVVSIKTKITTVFGSVKSFVLNTFNSIKNITTNVWSKVKDAIVRPIVVAKDKVYELITKIKGFFSNLHLSLPKIKLPHFRIDGSLSLNPPKVPKLNIDWYKEGGVLSGPTVFGLNGSSLMAGGESGKEAVLPLKSFYSELNKMLDKKLSMSSLEYYLKIIAKNSDKGIYLNSNKLVGELLPKIDVGLGQMNEKNNRGNR